MLRRAVAGWMRAERNVWTPAALAVLVVLSACGAETGLETAGPDATDEETESPSLGRSRSPEGRRTSRIPRSPSTAAGSSTWPGSTA